jgi:hypothetical protein
VAPFNLRQTDIKVQDGLIPNSLTTTRSPGEGKHSEHDLVEQADLLIEQRLYIGTGPIPSSRLTCSSSRCDTQTTHKLAIIFFNGY